MGATVNEIVNFATFAAHEAVRAGAKPAIG